MSSDDMRDADVANGEDPDEATRQPEDGPATTADEQLDPQSPARVPTGEHRAEENRENEPPA